MYRYPQVLGGTYFQLPAWHPKGLKYEYVQKGLHGQPYHFDV